MPQESTTVQWEPIYIYRDPGIGFKIYLLFLLVACVVTVFNLVWVWRAVPPFSRNHPVADSAYLKLLKVCNGRLRRWIGLVFLAWGLLTSTTLYDICSGLLLEKTTPRSVIVLVIQDFSKTLGLTLFVVLFLYLVRWHTFIRLERLRD